MDLEALGKLLLIAGGFLALLRVILWLAPHIPMPGRLPGDILIRQGSFSFYLPVATMILLSLLLTLGINFVLHLLR